MSVEIKGKLQDRSHQWSTRASPQSRPAVIFAWFWSFGTDGRTDNLCKNSDRYRPELQLAVWIKNARQEIFRQWIWKFVFEFSLILLFSQNVEKPFQDRWSLTEVYGKLKAPKIWAKIASEVKKLVYISEKRGSLTTAWERNVYNATTENVT